MKKFLFLVGIMLLCLGAKAQWDGTSSAWTQGTGTQNNPYLIENEQMLAYLAEMVSGGVNSYQNTYFLQTADLSMSNRSWLPIGDDTTRPFKGHYNGGNHKIDSVLLNNSTYNFQGLFGCVQNGSVRNVNCEVTIRQISPLTNHFVGGVCAYLKSGTLHGCIHRGLISDTSLFSTDVFFDYSRYNYIGGVVGYATNASTISNCGNKGDLVIYNTNTSGMYYSYDRFMKIAGVAGDLWGTVKSCFNMGNIYIRGNYYYSYWISSKYWNDKPIIVSGIANCRDGSTTAYRYNHVQNSFNSGNLTIIFITTSEYNTTRGAELSGVCHNKVLSSNNSNVSDAVNCYNSGTLTVDPRYKYGVAFNNTTNSYYRSDCGATAGGISRTETSMKSVSFPVILNADSIVFVMDVNNVNGGYPIHAWYTVYNVTTNPATNITSRGAELHGQFSGNADSVSFECWPTNGGDTLHFSTTVNTSPVTGIATNLQPATQYSYRIVASRDVYNTYGNVLTFTTYPIYTVSVASNNTVWGTVTGSGTFGYGDVDTLVATPAPHYQLQHWNSADQSVYSTDNPFLLTVTGNTTITAEFALATYNVSLSVNNVAWGSVTGGGPYVYGSAALLYAMPATGYHFLQWSDGNTDATRIVTVENDITLTAIFAPNQYTITLLSADPTKGTVSGGGTFDYGQQIYIIATPIGNYSFLQWSDGNTDAYRLLTVTQTITLTATFTDAFYSITGESNNAAWGSVAGGGSYPNGSSVTLTAVPFPGYHFSHWNDGSTDNPRTVIVSGDATYTAQFAVNNYTINAISADASHGSVTGGGIYSYMSQAVLQAVPMQNYHFTQWQDGNTSNPRVVTVVSDSTFTAQFEQLDQYTVTVVSDNPQRGTVTGGGTFYAGTQITISASAFSNYTFSHWSDGSTEATRVITVTQTTTYTAYFEATHYNVNVYSNDDNRGTVTGGGSYEYGSSVTVTATPAPGYKFVRWNNGVEINPYTFTVYNDVNLIANFERNMGIEGVYGSSIIVKTYNHVIHVDGADGYDVMVYDVMGRNVYSSKCFDGRPIVLSVTGVYLLRIGDIFTKKIVIFN